MEPNDDAPGSISPLRLTVRGAVRLAHNLRHLLTIMGRCSDAIRTEIPADTPAEKNLAELDRGIDRAFHLTHQLLALEHPTSRAAVVVDLHLLLAGAEDMIKRTLGATITPALRLTAGRPHVRADPYELEWILVNLLMNSREAMPNGGEVGIDTLDCSQMADGEGIGVVRMTVTDSGQNPPSGDEHLGPLPSSDASEIAVIRLGTVATLVENLGGWLIVEYQAGRGTTVHVDLPLA